MCRWEFTGSLVQALGQTTDHVLLVDVELLGALLHVVQERLVLAPLPLHPVHGATGHGPEDGAEGQQLSADRLDKQQAGGQCDQQARS